MKKQMNLKEKLYVKSERDGLTEIFTGLMFLFYASVIDMLIHYSTNRGRIGMIIIFFAFSGPIIQFLRKRLTYTKTGYVKVESKISKWFLFTTVFPIAFFPLILGLLKYVFKLDGLSDGMILYSPLFFGFIFCLFYLNSLKTTGKAVFRFFMMIAPLSGILIVMYNNSLNNEGVVLFFIINAIMMLCFGIIKTWRFFSNIKILEKGETNGK